jgi:hypothetical protein
VRGFVKQSVAAAGGRDERPLDSGGKRLIIYFSGEVCSLKTK